MREWREPPSQIPPAPTGWRGWFYFGPRSGIHSWLVADLTVVVIASFLTILYVWVDKPGPSDVGKHSLSGFLVALFGPTWALAGGMAFFTVLSGLLLWALIVYLRWATGPGREAQELRRLRKASLEAARKAARQAIRKP